MAQYFWKSNSARHNCWICNRKLIDSVKEHCRFCGDIVCYACSKKKMSGIQPIERTPSEFLYHPSTQVRVCDVCFIPITKNPDLKVPLSLARDIIIYLNGAIIKSPTRFYYGLANFHEQLYGIPLKELPIFARDPLFLSPDLQQWDLERIDQATKDRLFKEKALLSLKSGTGNCAEFTNCAFQLLKHKMLKKEIPHFELNHCYLDDGDHHFLLIGELNYHFSVICDPWSRKKSFWVDRLTNLRDLFYIPKEKRNPLKNGSSYEYQTKVRDQFLAPNLW